MPKEKWFPSGEFAETGWKKTQPPKVRRKKVLKAENGDLLASARHLQALANVTQDKVTKRTAKKDADYFFRRYRQSK